MKSVALLSAVLLSMLIDVVALAPTVRPQQAQAQQLTTFPPFPRDPRECEAAANRNQQAIDALRREWRRLDKMAYSVPGGQGWAARFHPLIAQRDALGTKIDEMTRRADNQLDRCREQAYAFQKQEAQRTREAANQQRQQQNQTQRPGAQTNNRPDDTSRRPQSQSARGDDTRKADAATVVSKIVDPFKAELANATATSKEQGGGGSAAGRPDPGREQRGGSVPGRSDPSKDSRDVTIKPLPVIIKRGDLAPAFGDNPNPRAEKPLTEQVKEAGDPFADKKSSVQQALDTTKKGLDSVPPGIPYISSAAGVATVVTAMGQYQASQMKLIEDVHANTTQTLKLMYQTLTPNQRDLWNRYTETMDPAIAGQFHQTLTQTQKVKFEKLVDADNKYAQRKYDEFNTAAQVPNEHIRDAMIEGAKSVLPEKGAFLWLNGILYIHGRLNYLSEKREQTKEVASERKGQGDSGDSGVYLRRP